MKSLLVLETGWSVSLCVGMQFTTLQDRDYNSGMDTEYGKAKSIIIFITSVQHLVTIAACMRIGRITWDTTQAYNQQALVRKQLPVSIILGADHSGRTV
jgi:hypothetical protein